jgi:hypothetical protein
VTPDRLWPPQCCVPAFMYAALVQLGVECPVPNAIPSILGVRVRSDDANPLGLALADAAHPPGIRGEDAEREVNRMCRDLELPIRLRRIPFNTVIEDLWEDILDTALAREAVVGVGVDYKILTGGAVPDGSAQHVLRVLRFNRDGLTLFDDSGESVPPMIDLEVARLRSAVLAILDGLWIVGPTAALNFAHTLPW